MAGITHFKALTQLMYLLSLKFLLKKVYLSFLKWLLTRKNISFLSILKISFQIIFSTKISGYVIFCLCICLKIVCTKLPKMR